ncbi:MAG: bifunctional phosphopantothenoylcysteine decarboxylase/phosphopantothenate--cysteine ligase CoaBC [Acidimicrobiaceae bacterium]|nr:bifunctional phosphopantothenoylcysteine decarboxylase/phosphopantothenate--cysteine ligase CoaBC [Acidimicrobiaceae bacterium]
MPSATPEPRRVVLGVTGGVAAYKAVDVLRGLRRAGYHVAPVLTRDALRFVGAPTFSALASEPVRSELYGDATTPIPHTYLGQGADLIVIAPATAHVIARLAMGLADDLLTATVLASRAPLMICPAMHTEMWEQPSVQSNLATLRARGALVVGPAVGALAGGDEGAGRLEDPERIVEVARAVLEGWRGPLSGRTVLVSAGGTREALDPVRVVTNRSSGRQGYALAEVAARRGARVVLVSSAERSLALDVAGAVEVISVESAAEMRDALVERAGEADVVVMAAAVADFTFDAQPQKWKKANGPIPFVARATEDIVSTLVERRREGQVIVAFAAETGDPEEAARHKLTAKGVDLIVGNDVTGPGAGFASSTNEVLILDRTGHLERLSRRSKEEVAEALLTKIERLLTRGD